MTGIEARNCPPINSRTKPPAYIPQKAANKTSRGTFCLTHYIALRQRVQGATPLAAGAKKFRLCKSRNLSVARIDLKMVAISIQVRFENHGKKLGRCLCSSSHSPF